MMDFHGDPDGRLLLGSYDGVYRFAEDVRHFERFDLKLPGNIETQNWVSSLIRDRSGTIWAGTVWGLHRLDPSADAFTTLVHDPADANSLSSGLVMSILEDELGALWLGT